jgi:hypothetical protein
MRDVPLYVVDMFADIIEKVSAELHDTLGDVHYIYGHPTEAVNTILEMTKNVKTAAKKYPLIYLYMDFDEDHDGTIEQGFTVSLHLAIATWTQPGWKADKRYTEKFKPVLYPIYDELMYQIARSGYFMVYSQHKIPHTKTDRPYWGSSNGRGNIADDHCDCIELSNMKLLVNFNFCQS